MKAMKFIMALILVATLFAIASWNHSSTSNLNSNKKALESLSGTYMDIKPYAYGKAFGQRIFTFKNGNWSLKFTLSLDPKLEHQVFEFRTFGSYKVLEPSKIVKGAFNAEFGEDKKFVTLKTDNPELIQAFGFCNCNLTPNVEKDISVSGCSLWLPVSECPIDYDLLALDKNGLLQFGVRPADNNMCSEDKRPKALTPGVTKVK